MVVGLIQTARTEAEPAGRLWRNGFSMSLKSLAYNREKGQTKDQKEKEDG